MPVTLQGNGYHPLRSVRGLALDLWDEDSDHVIENRTSSWGPQGEDTAPSWGPQESVQAVTGYQDCRAALSHPMLESQIDNSNLKQSDSNLLFLDGQAHERLRGIIGRALPSWRRTAASSAQFVDDLLERWPDDARIDIVNDFAIPIAGDATCTILGLPQGEYEALAPLLAAMSAQFDPGSDESTLTEAMYAGKEILSYFRLAIREKTYSSGSGLDLLNQARLAGDLSIREMLASSVMLAHASFQNSVNLLSFAAVETLTNVQVAEALNEGSSAARRSCVEELLRLGSPARYLIRRAGAELTIGAVPVSKGDIVIPCLGIANRDPAIYANPHQFDISRRRTPHLAFGAGEHACLGAAIARAETLAAVSALARKYRTLTFESVTWGSNAIMHGPTSLVVRLSV